MALRGIKNECEESRTRDHVDGHDSLHLPVAVSAHVGRPKRSVLRRLAIRRGWFSRGSELLPPSRALRAQWRATPTQEAEETRKRTASESRADIWDRRRGRPGGAFGPGARGL
eukprot:3791273-Pyramimonas_sp.AAC.1